MNNIFVNPMDKSDRETEIKIDKINDVEKLALLITIAEESIRSEKIRQKFIQSEIDYWEDDYDLQKNNFKKALRKIRTPNPTTEEIIRGQKSDLRNLHSDMDDCCMMTRDLTDELKESKMCHRKMVVMNTEQMNHLKSEKDF